MLRRMRDTLLIWIALVDLWPGLVGRTMTPGAGPSTGSLDDVDDELSASRPAGSPGPASSPYLHPKSDEVSMGCQELTSKRYISDGFCTSIRPVTERVCGGYCLPVDMMPWYAEFLKVWARTKTDEWRCVEDRIRRRWVTLLCQNGETRRYPIRVVAGCKCKRFNRSQNQSRHSNTARQSIDPHMSTAEPPQSRSNWTDPGQKHRRQRPSANSRRNSSLLLSDTVLK